MLRSTLRHKRQRFDGRCKPKESITEPPDEAKAVLFDVARDVVNLLDE